MNEMYSEEQPGEGTFLCELRGNRLCSASARSRRGARTRYLRIGGGGSIDRHVWLRSTFPVLH